MDSGRIADVANNVSHCVTGARSQLVQLEELDDDQLDALKHAPWRNHFSQFAFTVSSIHI